MNIKPSVLILALLGIAVVSSAITYFVVTSNVPEVVCPSVDVPVSEPVQRHYEKKQNIPYDNGERF